MRHEVLIAGHICVELENISLIKFFRFIYGQRRGLWSVDLAIDIYKFAHEMQIPSVMQTANEVLKTIMEASAALRVYSLFLDLDNKEGLLICKKV